MIMLAAYSSNMSFTHFSDYQRKRCSNEKYTCKKINIYTVTFGFLLIVMERKILGPKSSIYNFEYYTVEF